MTYRLAEHPLLRAGLGVVGVFALVALVGLAGVEIARWLRRDGTASSALRKRTIGRLATVGLAFVMIGIVLYGELEAINEGELLASGCVRFVSFVRSIERCPQDITQMIRHLSTADRNVYDHLPDWAYQEPFRDPEPGSEWNVAYEVQFGSDSFRFDGPDAAALARAFSQGGVAIRVSTQVELESGD